MCVIGPSFGTGRAPSLRLGAQWPNHISAFLEGGQVWRYHADSRWAGHLIIGIGSVAEGAPQSSLALAVDRSGRKPAFLRRVQSLSARMRVVPVLGPRA